MYIPFNEISLHKDFITSLSNFKKIESISEFINLYKVLKSENLLDGFFTQENSLSEISNLITTEGLTPQLKQSLLIAMKSFSQINPDNSLDEFKIEVNHKTYSGLGCAYASRPEFNKVIISFRSHDLWEQDFLEGKYLSLINENCIEENISLNQITLYNNIEIIKQISSSKKRNDISSGQDLWEKKENLYPHLIFCNNVKKQLYDTPQMVHIESVMDKLDILENCLNKNGSFSLVNLKNSGIDITPESSTVEDNSTLHNMRVFQLPNGNTPFFTYHIKFNTPAISPCRIYVYPDGDKCYIGYIGKHLPTAKF